MMIKDDNNDNNGDYFNIDNINNIKKCKLCKREYINTLVFCEDCSVLMNDYDKLRDYINNIDVINNDVLILLQFAKTNRLSLIISRADSGFFNDLLYNDNYDESKYHLNYFIKSTAKEVRELHKAINIVKDLISN